MHFFPLSTIPLLWHDGNTRCGVLALLRENRAAADACSSVHSSAFSITTFLRHQLTNIAARVRSDWTLHCRCADCAAWVPGRLASRQWTPAKHYVCHTVPAVQQLYHEAPSSCPAGITYPSSSNLSNSCLSSCRRCSEMLPET